MYDKCSVCRNALLGVLVLHFSGTQTDLSREGCLLLDLLILSPKVVY